jgi:hypothetical protein
MRERKRLERGVVKPNSPFDDLATNSPYNGKKILSATERLEELSKLVEATEMKPISAGAKIAAVAEMNRMTGAYPPVQHQVLQRVQFEIIHTPRSPVIEPPPQDIVIEEPKPQDVVPPITNILAEGLYNNEDKPT